MDSYTSAYRPQSPDLSTYTPQSPDLSGLGSANHPSFSATSVPPLGAISNPPQRYTQEHHNPPGSQFSARTYHPFPTSGYQPQPHLSSSPHPSMAPGQRTRADHDGEYYPNGPSTRSRRGLVSPHIPQYQQEQSQPQPQQQQFQPQQFQHQHNQMLHIHPFNGQPPYQPTHMDAHMLDINSTPRDPTHGVQLKTSFPVARIKRIMQADEDIGKVAQVTPHVVSRALELFMIKLITASAAQANGGGAAGKGQKRILAQHLKRVIMTDDNFDFLREIANKIPDAPVKGKKDAGSDSDESKPAKRRAKKRKDSSDDL